jgi:hypothetical protein
MFERLREQDRHFLMALYFITAVVLVWKGVWEGIGSLPFLSNPWGSLAVGLTMLTLTGLIFQSDQFDPLGSIERSTHKVIHSIHRHPKKHEFHIKYHDEITKKDITIEASRIQSLQKNFIVLKHENGKQETFIPMERVVEVLHKGKSYWKL